jgi:hypothetical protein
MSIMQREKTILQREKRLVMLQKSFLVMQDTIERSVAADEQRQIEFDSIKSEVSIVQRAIDTPGSIAKAADVANKRRRAQAIMAKALKLNRKHQVVAEKLNTSKYQGISRKLKGITKISSTRCKPVSAAVRQSCCSTVRGCPGRQRCPMSPCSPLSLSKRSLNCCTSGVCYRTGPKLQSRSLMN